MNKIKKIHSKESGISLIEIIIYVALVAFFFTGAIIFLWDLIYAKETAVTQNTDNYKRLSTLGRSSYHAFNKNTIESFETGLAYPEASILDLSHTNSINARVLTDNFSSSWELLKPDLEARNLLLDVTQGRLTHPGDQIINVFLKNSGTETITITGIHLEWFDTAEAGNVVAIQFNGGTINWQGSESSPAELDINDVSIEPGATISLDYVEFDVDLEEGYVIIQFIMADESFVQGEFDLVKGDGGTEPHPCSIVCMDKDYDYGICERNITQCGNRGGDPEPSGNQFCTEPAANVCCCMYD